MALTKEQKTEVLNNLKDLIDKSKSVVFADYQGLTVEDISNLRKKLREKDIKFHVAKKTLIKLAAKEKGYDDIPEDILNGPIGVAFSFEDEIAAARILNEFSKENNNLKLRGAFFEGRILSEGETKELASIPSKEELISKFIYLVKSPISGFHGVLNNTLSGFVRVLNAVKEKQEQAA